MRVSRGDVVLVDYPFASGTGSKVRPALVVQSDLNNAKLQNTIIVQITSRTRFASQPTQLLLEANSELGRQAGVLRDSAISAENIYTVRQDGIRRLIGAFQRRPCAWWPIASKHHWRLTDRTMTHRFTILIPELTDDQLDEIAGECPDSLSGVANSQAYIDFSREADSLGAAIDSAIDDLGRVGVQPQEVHVGEMAEVA